MMKAKLDEVRELGAAAAEEWFKGLELDGREKAADTARWEHWELAGGFQATAHSFQRSAEFQGRQHEPHRRFPTPLETKRSSCLGAAATNDVSSGRPTVNAPAHSWTNQGKDLIPKMRSHL